MLTRVCGDRDLQTLTQNRAFERFQTAAEPAEAYIDLNAAIDDRPYTVLHSFLFQNRIFNTLFISILCSCT